MNELALILLAFAAFVLLQPINRKALGVFGSIGGSETTTKVHAPTEKSPITADNAAVAVRHGGAHFDTLGTGATQFRLGAGAKLTINQTSDPDLLRSVFDRHFDTQQQTLEEILARAADAGSTADERLGTFLDELGQLAENKQTDGESGRNKTILYIVLAVLAVFAFRRL